MNFKFFKGKEEFGILSLEPMQVLSLRNERHNNNEYCFQFDDEEPYVFGQGHETLTMTIQPTTGGNISFQHNGRTFKIFARERQND